MLKYISAFITYCVFHWFGRKPQFNRDQMGPQPLTPRKLNCRFLPKGTTTSHGRAWRLLWRWVGPWKGPPSSRRIVPMLLDKKEQVKSLFFCNVAIFLPMNLTLRSHFNDDEQANSDEVHLYCMNGENTKHQYEVCLLSYIKSVWLIVIDGWRDCKSNYTTYTWNILLYIHWSCFIGLPLHQIRLVSYCKKMCNWLKVHILLCVSKVERHVSWLHGHLDNVALNINLWTIRGEIQASLTLALSHWVQAGRKRRQKTSSLVKDW